MSIRDVYDCCVLAEKKGKNELYSCFIAKVKEIVNMASELYQI